MWRRPFTSSGALGQAVLRAPRRLRALPAAALAALGMVTVAAQPAYANVPLTQVSSDPYTNSLSQHRTEVEPDTFAQGSTIVSTFQVGRVFDGGSANNGFATSNDGGATWVRGFLPGITVNQGGPYERASDPAVAFDARHGVWMISSLGVNGPGGSAIVTSRSTDGGRTWGNPVTVTTGSLDKNWIVCDNTASSPFFGNCYTQYDITSSGNAIRLQRSTDGGRTWGPARGSSDGATGLGGQPVVRPNGTVIVPYRINSGSQIRSFRSIDGGQSWRATVLVASVTRHTVAGNLRVNADLPSAEIDGAGTVYVAFFDCRFRSGCPSNDIVLSRSTSETTWAAPVRVPIDSTGSTVDHFVPGIGVDRSTSGSSARIGLTYYFYPNANCSASTCQLSAGFISSLNGGTSWSAATQLAGPMSLSWLPDTSQGRMFGDYISTSVLAGGRAFTVIPVANAPSGGTFDVAMYVPTGGLTLAGGTLQASGAGAAPAAAGPAAAPPQTAN